MEVTAKNLDETIQKLKAKSARLKDMTPAFKAFGSFLEKGTDDCFQNSADWDGNAFDDLAVSTIDARIAKAGGFKRTKSGKFTKGARKKQAAMAATGGIKILVDTARARNSQHTEASKDSLKWSAIGYIGPHITGSETVVGRPPKRNVSPFEKVGGAWKLNIKANAELNRLVVKHIRGEGSVA